MKKLTSILLALVLSLTLVFTLALSGCHLTDEDISSSTGGGNSSSTEPQAPQKTDRSAYTIQAADETVKALTLNGLFLDGKSALKGYMAGDMLNSAIETLAKSILDGAVDAGVNMEQLAAQFSYFEYEYYDDGSWYAKKDGKKVHPVLDAFLSYKLDGSEELKLTPEMLDHYKNETLLFITGYENDQKYQLLLTMVDQSGVIDTIMHAKVGDVAKIFSGDAKKVMEGVFTRMNLSARAYDRILRVARTLCDLDAFSRGITEEDGMIGGRIKKQHIAEAAQMRALDRKYFR